MELSCECGNEEDFYEHMIVDFFVDATGERQEKVSETTEFICINCGELAEVCE